MATLASDFRPEPTTDRPPTGMAYAMALTVIAGFSLQWFAGRSTFHSPLVVHAHALTFMGWVAIFVTQATLGARGQIDQHRKLAKLAIAWMGLMIVMGTVVTVRMIRNGTVPFFFRPQHFLIFDPMSVLFFAGMVLYAVSRRSQTDWHVRLQLGAMAILMGPAFGRLLPMPLLQPWSWECAAAACAIFPLIGMGIDLKRRGSVHPAWYVSLGALIAMVVVTDAVTYSALGDSLYHMASAGYPGATVPGLEFGTSPGSGLITGR
ncbi:MAG: hypothetical protein ACKOOL_07995 [Novosphingobium sp.]